MFERFSSGYYLGRLYVEPDERETAAMCREQHERVNEQLYTDGEGIQRLDNPLVMKLDASHFPVTGDDGLPPNTLAVPETVLEDSRIRNPPALREVLLAKADRAKQLLELTGQFEFDEESDGSGFGGNFGGQAF
ncbi:DUF5802 family protein [Halorientalis brevis]|uniref:DUF5802 family protein n=1 Tax=Halorientalis brevis TaxID=1126241 RepID=A0ABD6C692_9EURY|nr:DUF5802 family protein [Halorientalis brevis]